MISSLDVCMIHYRSLVNCRGAVGYLNGKPHVFLHAISAATCFGLRPNSVAAVLDTKSLYHGMSWRELFPVSKKWPPSVRAQIQRLQEMTKKSMLQHKHPLDMPHASITPEGEIEVSTSVSGRWIPQAATNLRPADVALAKAVLELVHASS